MKTKTARTLEDVLSDLQGWFGIGEIVERCERAGAFSHYEDDELIGMAKRTLIRQRLRASGKADPGDLTNSNEWVSILIQTKAGKRERKYKQLALFDLGDFVQVVRERQDRITYWRAETDRFVKLAVARFGKRAQSMFGFTNGN